MEKIEITALPEKVAIDQLTAEIRAQYPEAVVTYQEEINTISAGVRQKYPASIIIEASKPDAAALKAVVEKHKPEYGDDEKRALDQAAALFNRLAVDPRMKKIIEFCKI